LFFEKIIKIHHPKQINKNNPSKKKLTKTKKEKKKKKLISFSATWNHNDEIDDI
jgi:hypothetical protein